MEKMELVPFQRCGRVYLGMEMEEVDAILHRVPHTLKREMDYGLVEAYSAWYDDMRYYAVFINNRLDWLQIFNDGDEAPMLFGIALFQEKAEDVLSLLRRHAPCSWDPANVRAKLSYQYYFEEIGLSLWRDPIYHRKWKDDTLYNRSRRRADPPPEKNRLRFQHFQSAALESGMHRLICQTLPVPRFYSHRRHGLTAPAMAFLHNFRPCFL